MGSGSVLNKIFFNVFQWNISGTFFVTNFESTNKVKISLNTEMAILIIKLRGFL